MQFRREDAGPDILFDAHYTHKKDEGDCTKCMAEHQVLRLQCREDIVIHFGTIASGNQAIKKAVIRGQAQQGVWQSSMLRDGGRRAHKPASMPCGARDMRLRGFTQERPLAGLCGRNCGSVRKRGHTAAAAD
ncbi:hypothetical protein EJ06DRAFT_181646 [Trichodelitschia bisporula]|uniref:Uncharacterized protein n=1 Tax=Trichodelitschia bisporula TaxID=703511 RepID=A0A6G1HM89_9PEZI|nr:hypothetical protein EJ06DRAFT_181646 [Trichodelitschia bisporula]